MILAGANCHKPVWRYICISTLHNVHFKYLKIIYISYTSIKLKFKKNPKLLELKKKSVWR